MGTVARRLRQHLRMAGQLQDVDESPQPEAGVVDPSVLSQVDLAFVVDTTASMGQFIDAARRQMIRTLQELTAAAPIELRVAVVEYRDHPPQDRTFVSRAHVFKADLGEAQQMIEALRPDGGGDTPEAVYDGLRTVCNVLEWLPHSHSLAVLVGDVPPHGDGGADDLFPEGCPCGLDADAVTALLETEATRCNVLPMH